MRVLMAAAASILVSAAAEAGPVTPAQVETVLQDYGATLNNSRSVSDTAHVIKAEVDERSVHVRLDECNEANQCGVVIMFTAFGLDREIDEATLRKTNQYNDSYPIGRAFVFPESEGDGNLVGIDYVIDVSGEAVVDNGDLKRFDEAVDAYVDYWTGGN